MAYIYKPTRKRVRADGTVERYKSPKFYAVWKDARTGERASCPAYADEKASRHLAHRKERESAQAAEGLLVSDAEKVPLIAHLERWKQFKLDAGMTPKHAGECFVKLRKLFDGCKWTRLRHLSALDASSWLAQQRTTRKRFGAQTFNHYLVTLRSFARWAIRHRFMGTDPFAMLDKLPADIDPRHVRRVLTAAEFDRLLTATEQGKRYQNALTGSRRATLYTVAAFTGLRANELAMLTFSDVDLKQKTLSIPVRNEKARRGATLPLHDDAAAALASQSPSPGDLIFPGRWLGEQARMLRRDLAAAKIAYRTPAGVFDFHALRSQFTTGLALAGVTPQATSKLARHSDPRLTQRVYTRLGLTDLAASLNRLPAPRQLDCARKTRERAGKPPNGVDAKSA